MEKDLVKVAYKNATAVAFHRVPI